MTRCSTLGLTSFGGVSVDSTSTLTRYTLLGDATLDGNVNFFDLTARQANYDQSLPTGGEGLMGGGGGEESMLSSGGADSALLALLAHLRDKIAALDPDHLAELDALDWGGGLDE